MHYKIKYLSFKYIIININSAEKLGYPEENLNGLVAGPI
jgi:hypothetical protein